MAYRDLHGFLDKLEELGEIERDEAVMNLVDERWRDYGL